MDPPRRSGAAVAEEGAGAWSRSPEPEPIEGSVCSRMTSQSGFSSKGRLLASSAGIPASAEKQVRLEGGRAGLADGGTPLQARPCPETLRGKSQVACPGRGWQMKPEAQAPEQRGAP